MKAPDLQSEGMGMPSVGIVPCALFTLLPEKVLINLHIHTAYTSMSLGESKLIYSYDFVYDRNMT